MRKLFSTKKRIAAGVLSVAIIAGTAGIAAAYFTSTGSSSGNVDVGTPSVWGVTVAAGGGGPLYPGQGSETQAYTITNVTGTGAKAIKTITATVANSVTNAGCLGTWFHVVVGAPSTGFNTSIAPAAAATGTLTITMPDLPIDQTACAGLIDIPVTLNVT